MPNLPGAAACLPSRGDGGPEAPRRRIAVLDISRTPPQPTGKSGLTSSDDQPRYRRGSKRRPKPRRPRRAWCSSSIPRWRWRTSTGKARGTRRSRRSWRPRCCCRSAAHGDRRVRLGAGCAKGAGEDRLRRRRVRASQGNPRGTWTRRRPGEGRGFARAVVRERRRVARDARARLANSPFVRVTRVGKANGGDDGSKDLDTAAEQVDGKDTYAARLLARVSTCNHSCRPNAAVSVSDDLVTLYSLRRIEAGEGGCGVLRHLAAVAAAADAAHAARQGVGVRVQVSTLRD